MLAQLVQRAEYSADLRLIERRFTELEKDVEELRRAVVDEMRALRVSQEAAAVKQQAAIEAVVARQDAQAEKRGGNLRQAVYAGILPTVFILLTIAVQVWLAPRGGS
jgi:hypothetical protein